MRTGASVRRGRRSREGVTPFGTLAPPVRARLSNGAQCRDAFFLGEPIQKNDGTRFEATRKGLPVM